MTKDLFGWYYAQSPDGVVQIVQFLDGKCYYLGHEDIMAEPICLVPTYEEYEELKKFKHWEKISCDDEPCCKTVRELRGLLKGCNLSIFKIYDRLRFSDENEITPADLINAVDAIKPMLWGILNSINSALGESEE